VRSYRGSTTSTARPSATRASSPTGSPTFPASRRRTCVFYRYRIRLDAAELGFAGPAVELRDRVLWALQAEGVAASLWQLRPLPAQPLFRRSGPFRPWQPGDEDELEPWRSEDYPEANRLIDSSIVLGTAEHPLFNQPAELMERYVEAFEKVLGDREALFTGAYSPVQAWPPVPRERFRP
jgi:perosamine synthetase